VLLGAGHSPGAIDGRFGPATAKALGEALASGAVELVARTSAEKPATQPVAPVAALRFPHVERALREVIVHCTATRPDWMAARTLAEKIDEVRRWHRARGWRDIGYHFLIDRNGEIAVGRPLEQVGAHVIGRNDRTIGVALIGGHGAAATDRFSDHFTAAQDVALRQLIAALNQTFGGLALSGHNQWAAKACPGFNVAKWADRREEK
jgi:hypothetical protein